VFDLTDATDWIVAIVVAVVLCGVVFALAYWLLDIGYGPK
jgi:hypothetical protein